MLHYLQSHQMSQSNSHHPPSSSATNHTNNQTSTGGGNPENQVFNTQHLHHNVNTNPTH